MGQQQSKDELVYQQVNYGNIEGIKALCREGAGLEWIDREGKTPLIVACMNSERYYVAKTLIELGANVNAYRPGRHAGTPLHHAAKRGLERTVKLLLSHGANALIMNDDCQTPLDVARAKGFSNVVREIESHLCLFSGWLLELHGPGFLEVLARQWVSRNVWVVVLPCGSRNLKRPFKLELAIYSSLQDAQPRTTVALWRANMEAPKFNQPDPSVIIIDNSTKTRIKFSANPGDKQQLQMFCNACKGIPQVMHPNFPFNTSTPIVPPTAPPTTEDTDIAMAINASVQSAMDEGQFVPTPSIPSSSTNQNEEAGPSSDNSILQTAPELPNPASIPSAPLATDETIDDGPIHYPSIDFDPVDIPNSNLNQNPSVSVSDKKEQDVDNSQCVICLDAPVEGACIPCGHMAGCMSCLNAIKDKKGVCPVCRAKINQVVRLYAV